MVSVADNFRQILADTFPINTPNLPDLRVWEESFGVPEFSLSDMVSEPQLDDLSEIFGFVNDPNHIYELSGAPNGLKRTVILTTTDGDRYTPSLGVVEWQKTEDADDRLAFRLAPINFDPSQVAQVVVRYPVNQTGRIQQTLTQRVVVQLTGSQTEVEEYVPIVVGAIALRLDELTNVQYLEKAVGEIHVQAVIRAVNLIEGHTIPPEEANGDFRHHIVYTVRTEIRATSLLAEGQLYKINEINITNLEPDV